MEAADNSTIYLRFYCDHCNLTPLDHVYRKCSFGPGQFDFKSWVTIGTHLQEEFLQFLERLDPNE